MSETSGYEIKQESWQHSLNLVMYTLKKDMPSENTMNAIAAMMNTNPTLTFDQVEIRLRVTNCPCWLIAMKPSGTNSFSDQAPFRLREETKDCVLLVFQLPVEIVAWKDVLRELPWELRENTTPIYKDNLERLRSSCGLPTLKSVEQWNLYQLEDLLQQRPQTNGTSMEMKRELLLALVRLMINNEKARQRYFSNETVSFINLPRFCISKHSTNELLETVLLRNQVNILYYSDPLKPATNVVVCKDDNNFKVALQVLEQSILLNK